MRIQLCELIPEALSRCGEIIAAPYTKAGNSTYALIFNTHIATFFSLETMSRSFKQAYINTILEAVIPLSLLTTSSGGRLKLAVLNIRDPDFQRAKEALDYLGADWIACDFDNLEGFSNAYDAWRNHTSTKMSPRERIVNKSEAALRRDINVGLKIRNPSWLHEYMYSPESKEAKDRVWGRLRAEHEARKTMINMHPEYALSKLFQIEDSDLTETEKRVAGRARVDFLVSVRMHDFEPKYGGKPLIAAEFDGPVHINYDYQRQVDAIKNKFFLKAGIPYLRVLGVGAGDSTLQPLESNDNVLDQPKVINRFIRSVVDMVFEWRMGIWGIEWELNLIDLCRNFAYAHSRGEMDWTRVEGLVRRMADSRWGSDDNKEKTYRTTLRNIREESQRYLIGDLGPTKLDEAAEELRLERSLIIAEFKFGRNSQWDESSPERWAKRGIEVQKPVIRLHRTAGLRGSVRYRSKAREAAEFEEISVGPFTVELIVQKDEREVYERVMKEAIGSMLWDRLEDVYYERESPDGHMSH